MRKNWINTKELREQLDFAAVLESYGVELQVKKGNQHQGFCPLPCHGGSGERKSPSFSADLDKGIFQCFGCGGKGNIIDFVILMAGESKDDKQAFRRASVLLKEKFMDGKSHEEVSPPQAESKKKPLTKEASDSTSRIINPVLTFSLKNLNPDHPYLNERGFDKEVASHFESGHCSKGMMKNRIAFPLHNPEGELVGYAGRIIDDSMVDENTPKYRFPGTREVDGKTHEFRKNDLLYNYHRLRTPVRHLVIVEGFFHVWRLHQAGISAVSVMGSSISERQLELILSLSKKKGYLWLIPDPDKAGERMIQDSTAELAKARYTRILELPKGKDVADLSVKELLALLPSKAAE